MKAKDKLAQVGRVAYRVENTNWNAYWAMPDTMKGAVFIGSIPIRSVDRPERKAAFMALMQDIIADIFEEQWGVRPTWPNPPRPAPKHERTRE